MAIRNLISASIPQEVKKSILEKLVSIKSDLSFLLSLQSNEIQSLFKASDSYAPFIEKAYNTVNDHPEIMSGVFDIAEFKKDYELSKDIVPIINAVNELAESLQKTQIAINSDAMTEALEVYAAVKQNKDKIPGLNVVSDEMGAFFKRTRKKTS